jgi:hypothetical protein
VEILQGKEDTKDVVPTAFFVTDWDSWVWAVHTMECGKVQKLVESLASAPEQDARDLNHSS